MKCLITCGSALLLVVAMQGTASAQQGATTTQTMSVTNFEVVGVQGNTVTVKTPKGAKEVTVDDSFRFTVDGKPVTVHDLKPGMKGTATITTTTTTTPVVVTEVKNGQVVKTAGSSIIVSTAGGYKMFTEADLAKRGVKIMKDGQPAELSSLREGDNLTATIVTTHPPKVVTKQQVDAGMTSPAAMASSSGGSGATKSRAAGSTPSGQASSGAAASGEAASETAGGTHKKLPKTASVFPLVGLVGASLCGIALMLGIARRRAF
jgi:hypothetical protein